MNLKWSAALVFSVAAAVIDPSVTQATLQVSRTKPELRGKIVFASNRDGDYDLFILKLATSERRKITHNKVDDYEPTWSPDGHRIAFTREVRYNEDIYILDLRTGTERRLTDYAYANHEADWGPRKRWIAYGLGDIETDGADIVAERVNGSKGRLIESQDENDVNQNPSWSPDGKKLVYDVSWDGTYLAKSSFCCSDGYKDRPLEGSGNYEDENPAWSPTGNEILFTSLSKGTGWDLWLMDIDGENARVIKEDAKHSRSGSWSADGELISYYSNRKGSWDIFVMTRGGKHVDRLTDHPRDEIHPDWHMRMPAPR